MKYVIANWKMYPQTKDEAIRIFADTVAQTNNASGVRVGVCPPYVWIPLVASLTKPHIWLGAQDAFWAEAGAFTGEIAPAMLKDIGCKVVIVGHSERRHKLGESEEIIAKKVAALLKSGFWVVLCVGERKREGEWEKEILSQIRSALSAIPQNLALRLLVAYEPVWAIGTGVADTPKDAVTSILLIRRLLKDIFGSPYDRLPVLYGGSVTAANATGFLAEPEVDGFLIGHASLDAREFSEIVRVTKG